MLNIIRAATCSTRLLPRRPTRYHSIDNRTIIYKYHYKLPITHAEKIHHDKLVREVADQRYAHYESLKRKCHNLLKEYETMYGKLQIDGRPVNKDRKKIGSNHINEMENEIRELEKILSLITIKPTASMAYH